MSPDECARGRHLSKAQEAPPEEGNSGGPLYVVQKHDASRLHYDLRLECGGALLSWAVPKGPSLNPAHKRLAVMVEDHPLDYADFEGTISPAEYGGGTVMVWDIGTYECLGDQPMAKAVQSGFVEIVLHGSKLKGGWKFVQWKRRGERNWLLIKKNDEHADRETDITKAMPHSALTGRTLAQIAEGNP